MGSVSTTVYTCDRDGTVSEPSSAGLPVGWSTVQTTTVPEPPPALEGGLAPLAFPMMRNMVLCPACSAGVTAAMKKAEGYSS